MAVVQLDIGRKASDALGHTVGIAGGTDSCSPDETDVDRVGRLLEITVGVQGNVQRLMWDVSFATTCNSDSAHLAEAQSRVSSRCDPAVRLGHRRRGEDQRSSNKTKELHRNSWG